MQVSVIMPVGNASSFVSQAIESILKQTLVDFEFLIIDDASTDGSWEIIQSFAQKDDRIRCFRNARRLGIVKTRNKGFQQMNSETEFVAIFDADDISYPTRLEKQVQFLAAHPNVGAVGSHITIINESGKKIALRKYPLTFSNKKLLFRSPFAQPAVMIRKQALHKVGRYRHDGKYDRARDYDLWLRLAKHYDLATIDKPLLYYRFSKTQGKSTHLKETLRSTLQVKRKYLFTARYFSLPALMLYLLEYCLLFLPGPLILWLFKLVMYRKKQ